LKLQVFYYFVFCFESRPVRARGLKPMYLAIMAI